MSKESKRISEAIKPALSGALSTQAYTALVGIPGIGWFFALPVVSYFTKAVIDRVAEWLVQETAVGLSILWIQLDMSYGIKNSKDAEVRLRDMLENPQKYSEKQQKEIEENFDETTINLIQLGIDRL